jgi:hypothetical protein
MRNLHTILFSAAPLVALVSGCSSAPAGDSSASTSDAIVSGGSIATIAMANLHKGACSVNSAGGRAFDSSCTGNGGQPEYWCADFARWVWARAGVPDTSQLTAAAGSFYVYGQNHNTLHSEPSVGDAVVFDYHGGGSADHVAIVTKVNSNDTIETISGDWGGQSGSEAHFASTSHVDLNTPGYGDGVGTWSGVMGMTISGFISPARRGAGTGHGCYSQTLGREMPDNACVQSKFDDLWYQCNDGTWVDRWTDPEACNGVHPL